MRDIKFRAWNGLLMIYRELTDRNWYDDKNLCVTKAMPEDKGILKIMQYVGSHDDDSNEVYEKDIVQYDGEDGIVTAIIEFAKSEEEASFFESGYRYKVISVDDYPEDNPDEPVGFHVIGNIYETPELVKNSI